MANDGLIKDSWHELPGQGANYLFKELAGNKALFYWHCGCRMRRIIRFMKKGEKITRVGLVGYVCEVCGMREELPPEPI